eukprot:GHVS01039848.1.p1 GENE.GHVS01039848.1~~GHVS01039848.1.p1  ORF type:complete len:545 (-),score=136.88 GHVS01039848.1:10-1599(-)
MPSSSSSFLLPSTPTHSKPLSSSSGDLAEAPLEPSVAFETFRGKTYRSTKYEDGFSISNRGRTTEYEMLPSVSLATRQLRSVRRTEKGEMGEEDDGLMVYLPQAGEGAEEAGGGRRELETPAGKLMRLKKEMGELKEYVEGLSSSGGGGRESHRETTAAQQRKVDDAQGESKSYEGGGKAGLRAADPGELAKELAQLEEELRGALEDPLLRIRSTVGLRPDGDLEVEEDFGSAGRIWAEGAVGTRGGENFSVVVKQLDAVMRAMELQKQATTKGAKKGEGDEEVVVEQEEVEDMHGKVTRVGELNVPLRKNMTKTEEQKDASATTDGASSSGPAAVIGGGSIRYELYCVPSMKPFLERAKLATLERRIAEIENRIGVEEMSTLPYNDIISGVRDIEKRLRLLQPSRIESMAPKIKSLMEDMQSLQFFDDGRSVEEKHVASLYDLCERWRSSGVALPAAIQRLQSLKALHQEAGGISTRLAALEKEQQELSVLLESTVKNFESLQTTVENNLSWAKRTVEGIQRRMDQLK